jgi:hypothetical protein
MHREWRIAGEWCDAKAKDAVNFATDIAERDLDEIVGAPPTTAEGHRPLSHTCNCVDLIAANARIEELEAATNGPRTVHCVYCGWIEPAQTIDESIVLGRNHIAQCDKHPLGQMRKERDTAILERDEAGRHQKNAESERDAADAAQLAFGKENKRLEDALRTARANNARLEGEAKQFRDDARGAHESYLRIRTKLKAFDTKPGGEDRFEVTEAALDAVLADIERLTKQSRYWYNSAKSSLETITKLRAELASTTAAGLEALQCQQRASAGLVEENGKLERELKEAIKAGDWARGESTEAKGELIGVKVDLRRLRKSLWSALGLLGDNQSNMKRLDFVRRVRALLETKDEGEKCGCHHDAEGDCICSCSCHRIAAAPDAAPVDEGDNPFCAAKCSGTDAASHALCRSERFDIGVECSRGLLAHTAKPDAEPDDSLGRAREVIDSCPGTYADAIGHTLDHLENERQPNTAVDVILKEMGVDSSMSAYWAGRIRRAMKRER